MFVSRLGKYKTIVVSIALFLVLDISVLILNFYISFQISSDAVGVNIAGRQRMLSQRMVKSLYDLEISSQSEQQYLSAQKELDNTVSTFDTTLNAFDRGGVVLGANGEQVTLERITSQKGRNAITQSKQIWETYKNKLRAVTARSYADVSELDLSEPIAYAKDKNLTLLRLMNDLTVDLEQVASSKATRLRIIQTIGISLAVVNFLIILFHFIRQLNRTDQALAHARGETEEILRTVNEGLFLVDAQGIIASQHSSALHTLFGQQEIAGKSFESLLTNIIRPKDLENTERFITLLFKPEIKSNLIKDLNPLKQIEVSIPNESGGFETRYFKFDFQRAYEGEDIKDILITVSDLTDKVMLEKELAATQDKNEQQFEVLTGVLHAAPATIARFVNNVFKHVTRMNTSLKNPTKSERALRDKLNSLLMHTHSIKGEASALSLQSYVDIAHEFEQEMLTIKDQDKVISDDFVPLVVHLEKLMKHNETVQVLSEKLLEFSNKGQNSQQNSKPARDWSHLYELAANISERTDKDIELTLSGLGEYIDSEQSAEFVNDIAIQCIRNAILHGIEKPDIRHAAAKKPKGRIDLRVSKLSSGHIELMVQDDGGGIDFESVKDRALASGKWTETELNAWDRQKIASLIFEPGLSTETSRSIDAGTGMGMDVIKTRVREAGGKIHIKNRVGKGTSFYFTLPEIRDQDEAA